MGCQRSGNERTSLLALTARAGLLAVALPSVALAQDTAPPATPMAMPSQPPPPASLPPPLGAAAASEAALLLKLQMRLALGRSLVRTDPAAETRAVRLAVTMLHETGHDIDQPQILLLVDRAPAVQRLWVVVAAPGSQTPWPVVGAVRVSTGKPGRSEHFKTPVGVFTNSPSILGYRAQGTFNEHGVRGIGLKGMRVWDLGWQTTENWRKPDTLTAVRLEMHATDPTFLESRLGRPDSEACIRIPASFNQFMDHTGLIDGQLVGLVPQSRAIAALLPKDRVTTPLAGDKVVVVDSSEPDTVPSDPAEAVAINQRFADWLTAQALAAANGQHNATPGADRPVINAAGIVPKPSPRPAPDNAASPASYRSPAAAFVQPAPLGNGPARNATRRQG